MLASLWVGAWCVVQPPSFLPLACLSQVKTVGQTDMEEGAMVTFCRVQSTCPGSLLFFFCSSGRTNWLKKVKECPILLQWLSVSAPSDNKICNSRKQLFLLMNQHWFHLRKWGIWDDSVFLHACFLSVTKAVTHIGCMNRWWHRDSISEISKILQALWAEEERTSRCPNVGKLLCWSCSWLEGAGSTRAGQEQPARSSPAMAEM